MSGKTAAGLYAGYICSRSVVQLKNPSAIEQNTIGMSIIILLEPLKGYPIAKSNPKISKNKPATTNPKIHKALGMKAIPGTSDAVFFPGFNLFTLN